MVGAVILARISDDPALSDKVLAATRAWLDDQASPAVPAGRSRRRAGGRKGS